MDRNRTWVYGRSMQVDLPPELEALVESKVRSGAYRDRADVVRDALRLMAKLDHLRTGLDQHLSGALTEGLDQADRGELIDWPVALQDLREMLRTPGSTDDASG